MTILAELGTSDARKPRSGLLATAGNNGERRMMQLGVEGGVESSAKPGLLRRNFHELLPPPSPKTPEPLHTHLSTSATPKYSRIQHTLINHLTMPPVRTARASKKPPPDGFDDLEDTLLEFQNKMRDAENASHEGKKKYEMTWPIFQITHQRSRYIYDLYYEKEAISKQLYDYLLKNGYADAMLIAKWKKQGYEKVCLQSICYSLWG